MDAPQKTRVLNRSRIAQPSQAQRGEKQVVIPMTREQADEHWRDSAKMCKFIDGVMVESPELFPACVAQGLRLAWLCSRFQKTRWLSVAKNSSQRRLRSLSLAAKLHHQLHDRDRR